jgi:hypothetical protein
MRVVQTSGTELESHLSALSCGSQLPHRVTVEPVESVIVADLQNVNIPAGGLVDHLHQ